jgi:hypothetical protein
MRRTDKTWIELNEPAAPFLPEESVDAAAAAAADLRARMAKLEQQVLAQYSAMAAYATIAQQNVDAARAESKSDIEHSQSKVIGLLEKLRNETRQQLTASTTLPGAALPSDAGHRLSVLEDGMSMLANTLHQVLQENQEMRAQMSTLIEFQMRHEGWLVNGGSAAELSLR